MSATPISNVILKVPRGSISDIFHTEMANRIDRRRRDVYFRDASPISRFLPRMAHALLCKSTIFM